MTIATMANAQIIYTDQSPDYELTDAPGGDGEGKVLDLDNDGINDFVLAVYSSISGGGSLFINRAGAGPYSNSINSNGVLGFIMPGSTYYVSALNFEDSIDNNQNFWSYPGLYGTMVWYSLSAQGTFGQWDNVEDMYMGVRFIGGDGNKHYGWVRMDVVNNPIKIVLKDYAYENTPDKVILAGASISLGASSTVAINTFGIFSFDKNIFVQSPSGEGVMTITVTDISGKVVIHKTTNENSVRIPMKNFSSGIYLVNAVKSGQEKTHKVSIR